MQGSRAAKLALFALCALGPLVFLVKAAVKPEGDVFPAPSPIPAVPVILLTISGVGPADIVGPRNALPMPHFTALLRDSTQFASAVTAAPGAPGFLTSILAASFPPDHGVVSDTTKMRPAFPTLATELKRQAAEKNITIPAAAFLNQPAATAAGIQAGFDPLSEKPGARPAELVGAFDTWLGAATPPRFFAWLHFGDATAAGAERAEQLRSMDGAIGDLVALLHRRRIGGDGVILIATDPGAAAGDLTKENAARGIVAIQLPYEYRSGIVCPLSISSVDLAPTALELLRLSAPPAWRGRGRARVDIAKFVSSGPAIAGPFAAPGGEAWIAEQWPRTLWATRDGATLKFTDRNNPANQVAPADLLNSIKAVAAGGAR